MNLAHDKIRIKSMYCAICSYSETITFQKRKFQKKGDQKWSNDVDAAVSQFVEIAEILVICQGIWKQSVTSCF